MPTVPEPFELPPDFLLGSATASLQIEGGDTNNTWYEWCHLGKIKDGSTCDLADDHWNRYKQDIALIKKMNHQVYRLSLEWARIEPEMGQFDASAIEHYRDEIQELVKADIRPLVTLHHFSNPLWLERMGGWLNTESVGLFERYAQFAAYHLGDLVSDWVTINEPNVYLYFGYMLGIWPPGHKKMREYFKGAKNMILAHILAYDKIHEMRNMAGFKDTAVGAAYHMRVYDPKNNKKGEQWAANNVENLFQEIFVTGMTEGKFGFPLGAGNYPLGKGVFSDFLGINYYTRDMVTVNSNPGTLFANLETNPDAPHNDLGWEIYPEGLYRITKKYFQKYYIPIYITENGTCDAKDAFRSRYIYDHLYQIHRLLDEGINVQRYYHWSTLDNFEWLEGLSARFGLVEVDYANQKRSLRKSGEFYGEICKRKGVNQRMIDKYLK